MTCDSCRDREAAVIFGPEDLGLRAYWGLCIDCALTADNGPPIDAVCERLGNGVVAGALALGMAERPSTTGACSFCMRSRRRVRSLVAGPAAAICDECVTLAADVMADEQVSHQ